MLISDIRQRALKVDKGGYGWNVRFVPIADIATVLDMTRQIPTEEAFILTSINAARTLYIETLPVEVR